MKLKVTSDGTPSGTRVYDLDREEGDQDISRWVNAVEWQHEAGSVPACQVTFVAAALDFVGEARASTEAIVEARSNLGGQ